MASHRRTAAAALAVLLASVSLYPIFTGMTWFWAGAGAILVVALAGTATRLRRLPVAADLVLGTLALLFYLNLAFSNARSLWHLLPTPASVQALWHVAGQGFIEAGKYAPPVPELRGMVLIAAAGIGISALLTDLIAVRLGSAALAGIPLLLLFMEPFTLSVSRGFLGTTIAFCVSVAGYLTLLSSESRDRIREWEQPDPSPRDVPDTKALAAAGRRVGFASVVLALCLPLFIPGLHTTRLFGGQPGIGGKAGSGHGGGGVGFPDPNTQLSLELHAAQQSTVLVYRSTASEPDYFQIYVLDHLTDSGWQLFSQPESLVSVDPRLPSAPGLTTSSWVTKETTQVTIADGVGDDALSALPVPYPATTVTAKGTLHADRSTLMVFDPGTPLSGLSYSVTSLAASPPAALLDAAPSAPASITSHDLSVPASYDSLRALAQSVVHTAGASTPFQEAVALQDWLGGGSFQYSLNAPTVLDATALTKFLEVTKKGYCQQFSFAMAALARLLGIPSRVVYGFTSGTSVGDGKWVVTTHDAHAWPELYFQGYGWLRFEPTPSGPAGQGTATTPAYALTPGSPTGAGINATGSATAPTGTPATAVPGASAALRHLLQPPGGAGSVGVPEGRAGTGGVSPWEVLGLVLAGLVVLTLIAPWCARLVIRRRRWRHRGMPRVPAAGAAGTARAVVPQGRDAALAHAAWRELHDDLVDHGVGSLPSESPRAVAARVGTGLGLPEPARAAIDRIAMAEERASYAAQPADGSTLHADSVTVRRAIAGAVPRGARWRARLMPASVLGPVLGVIASVTDPYRAVRRGVPAKGSRGHDQVGSEPLERLRA